MTVTASGLYGLTLEKFLIATSMPTSGLESETAVKVLNNLDVRGSTSWDVLKGRAIENRVGIDWRFSCWSVTAEYVNRHSDESEFRVMVNLLGVGQVGTSARAGGF